MSETPWPARGCELYGHTYLGRSDCRQCGAPYVELTDIERRIAAAVKYSLHDEAGRDQHAEEVARKVSRALGLTLETQTLPVFVNDDPPAFHQDMVNPRPKRHIEFYDHTRHTTPWHSPDCPDCRAEPGVHDRRHREILAATLERDQ